MAVLNLDASEPYVAPATSADSSALFPSAPIYARKPTKKSSRNLPLIIGLPVLAIAAGGLAWGLMNNPAQTPTTDEVAVNEAQPLPAATPPAPMPAPAPLAAEPAAKPTPAPTQVARAETTAPPRVTAPAKRAAPARRAAPATAPDAESASSNVSATVPAPVAAPAPTPVIAAPAAPAPTPAPAPVTPVTPDAPM